MIEFEIGDCNTRHISLYSVECVESRDVSGIYQLTVICTSGMAYIQVYDSKEERDKAVAEVVYAIDAFENRNK